MTVSVISAPQKRRGGDKLSQQVATLSTASLSLDVSVDLVRLGAGTATVFTYYLPTSTGGDFPVEGQSITIMSTGTGDNAVWISGTSTGRHFLGQDGIACLQYWAGNWRPIHTTATITSAS